MINATRITATVLALALTSTAAVCRAQAPPESSRTDALKPARGQASPKGDSKREARPTAEVALARTSLTRVTPGRLRPEEPKKQWVWLEKQGVWGYGYQVSDGPHRGLWRIDEGSKRAPEASRPASDPYGFGAIVNRYRASIGLAPLQYDPDLSDWAVRNSQAQHSHGLGHHVNPNCHQNCAYNTQDAESTAAEWMSPGHREEPARRSSAASASPSARGRTGSSERPVKREPALRPDRNTFA
ncbi:MAG: CAP domain-containing protein [Isosphaeraceae bacterium]